MKRARFNDEQNVRTSKEADRLPVTGVAKRQGVSAQTRLEQARRDEPGVAQRRS
jgi:hypothetical protein